MASPSTGSLIQSFGLTHRIIGMQTRGLTHADSLMQLPFRGNCLNWVVGHIVVGRNRALALVSERPIWEPADLACYETGSEPITRADQALALERLLHDLDRSQQRLVAALEALGPESLAQMVAFQGDEVPLGQALAGLHWHETYHTGQLELLRQLAGTDDRVI